MHRTHDLVDLRIREPVVAASEGRAGHDVGVCKSRPRLPTEAKSADTVSLEPGGDQPLSRNCALPAPTLA